MYITDTDDLRVRGWITGTGYARRMTSVDNNISTFNYPRTDVYTKTEVNTNYYNISGVNRAINSCVYDYLNLSGVPLYSMLMLNALANNYFYTVTGGTNLNFTADAINNVIKHD